MHTPAQPATNHHPWYILHLLISEPAKHHTCPAEVERLAAWADPLEAYTVPPSAAAGLSASQWSAHVRTAWTEASPHLAVALSRRFPEVAAIRDELQRLVARDAGEAVVQVRNCAALVDAVSMMLCLFVR